MCAISTRWKLHAPLTTRSLAASEHRTKSRREWCSLASDESGIMMGADLLIDGDYTAV
jgi:hypothetical protein